MYPRRQPVLLVLCLLFAGVAVVHAAQYDWLNVGTDWLTPGNWTTNTPAPALTAPGSGDIVRFGTAAPAFQPALGGSASVLGLTINDSASYDWQINGAGQVLTIGTSGIAKIGQRGTTVIAPDISLNGSQTWYAQNTEGFVRLHILQLTGALTGAGDLAMQWRGGGEFRFQIGDGVASRSPGGVAFSGNASVSGCSLIFQTGPQTAAGSFLFGGVPATPGTLTLDGGTFQFNATANTGGGLALSFANPLRIAAGGGILQGAALGTDVPVVSFTGGATLGGPLALRQGQTTVPIYDGTWSLLQSDGGTCGFQINAPGYDTEDYSIPVPITDGAGHFANPLILQSVGKFLRLTAPAAGNKYAHGAVVDYCGFPYKGNEEVGAILIDAASGLGGGDLTVLPGGKIQLGDAANLDAGAVVYVQSSMLAKGVVGMNYDGLPTFDSHASGVVAIDATYSANIDQSTVGDGQMFLGTTDGGTLSGAVSPGAGNTYRIGAGGGAISALSLSGVNVLTGTAALQVGVIGWQGNGSCTLVQTNSFSGSIDVRGVSYHNRDPNISRRGSVLTGNARAGGSPFGDTNGVVFLRNSTYAVSQGAVSASRVRKATLTFEGGSELYMDCNNYNNFLQLGQLVRLNRGMLSIYDYRSSLGVREKFFLETPPAETSGMQPPWLVHRRGLNFVHHDAAAGLVDFAAYVTDVNAATAGNVVNTAGDTLTDNRSCYAIRVGGALGGAYTLAVGSGGYGGLILVNNVACNLDFGSNEGILYANGNRTVAGSISGSNGITVDGDTASSLYLSSTASAFTGQISAVGGSLQALFDTATGTGSLGATNNAIYIDGGALVCRGNDRLLASRTITLGTCGGMLTGPATVYAKITGAGPLQIGAGSYCGTVTFDNPDNDYTGGTYLLSSGGDRTDGSLIAAPGAKLGTGDLFVNAFLVAQLKGDLNINANANVQVAMNGRVEFQSASPAIGGLLGAGWVDLGTASAATTLSIGGSASDSTFYGRMDEVDSGHPCGVTKVGTGTFTLYGNHAYTGATTVNNGKLVLMGSVASNLTVNANGTLGGCGHIAGNLVGTGKLEIVLRGESDYDYLTVGGHVDLSAAALVVVLADGYNPTRNSQWRIVRGAASLSGTFAQVTAGFEVAEDNGDLVLSNPSQGTLIMMQ